MIHVNLLNCTGIAIVLTCLAQYVDMTLDMSDRYI